MNDELSELCIRALHGSVAEIRTLHELNAELLAHLRDALDALRRDEPTEAILDILAAIAKAEALK